MHFFIFQNKFHENYYKKKLNLIIILNKSLNNKTSNNKLDKNWFVYSQINFLKFWIYFHKAFLRYFKKISFRSIFSKRTVIIVLTSSRNRKEKLNQIFNIILNFNLNRPEWKKRSNFKQQCRKLRWYGAWTFIFHLIFSLTIR